MAGEIVGRRRAPRHCSSRSWTSTFSPPLRRYWTVDVETTWLSTLICWAQLPFGGGRPELDMPNGRGPVAQIICLTPPTKTLRQPQKHRALWRVVSHLSLNHLSIAEGEDGVAHFSARD